MRVEHELHQRRAGRNLAVMVVLLLFAGMVFGLTVVKVMSLGDLGVGNRMDGPDRSVVDPEYQGNGG